MMVESEEAVRIFWSFAFAIILMVSGCIGLRILLLCLVEKNIFNLQTIFSNVRILQTKEEKKACDSLAKNLKNTFESSNTRAMVPIHPQFIADGNPHNNGRVNHWPLFQIAIDGKILDPERLVATHVPDYNTVVGNQETETETPSTSDNMLTHDYFRDNVQPLGMNTSLNRHDDSRNSFASGSFGSFSSSQDHVPVDRPLFVNTSMSAQQRVDLYRRLSDPPKDNEPALAFSFRGY